MGRKPWLFVGNHPALDFLNTRLARSGEWVDRLETCDDLCDWMARAGLIPGAQAAHLAARWRGRPEARRALAQARRLREALRALLECRRGRQAPGRTALAAVNAILSRGASAPALDFRQGRYRFEALRDPRTAERLLEPIAALAGHLLSHAEPERVKACGRAGRVLWFLDTSKNGGRRWCSMAICGNRVKAAAFYRRRSSSLRRTGGKAALPRSVR